MLVPPHLLDPRVALRILIVSASPVVADIEDTARNMHSALKKPTPIIGFGVHVVEFLGSLLDVVIFEGRIRIQVRFDIDLPSWTAYTYWRCSNSETLQARVA